MTGLVTGDFDFRGTRTLPPQPDRVDKWWSVRQALDLRIRLELAQGGRCSLSAIDGSHGRGEPHAAATAIVNIGVFSARHCSPAGAFAIQYLETLADDLPVDVRLNDQEREARRLQRTQDPLPISRAIRALLWRECESNAPRRRGKRRVVIGPRSKVEWLILCFPREAWGRDKYNDLTADAYSAVQRAMDAAGVLV